MINYAHRGASEYAPENTLSAFYLGLLQGANGIETDVQRAKDGTLVLFHDETVDRATSGSGKIADHTLSELLALDVCGNTTTGFTDKIITFREFLEKFSAYDIQFAIELKGEGVEEEALEMVKEFGILHKTTFTSFNFEYIEKIKELDKTARVSWLTRTPDEESMKRLLSIGGEEIAPKAELITEEWMKRWRENGLGVRAWGVFNIPLMKKMCQIGVDGMTVNFPDRLYEFLRK
ncbi:MAG: hypothetical protein IJN74_04825 [Clostridia bacterium]|nr:hypothetical protein [Clostridia bacterium]